MTASKLSTKVYKLRVVIKHYILNGYSSSSPRGDLLKNSSISLDFDVVSSIIMISERRRTDETHDHQRGYKDLQCYNKNA